MRNHTSFTVLHILLLATYAIAQPKCNKEQPVDHGYWVNAVADPPLPMEQTTCSANVTNKSCTIVVDRLRVLTPPTINVHSSQPVTVIVRNISPFETLTLDWKSAAEVIPPDTFQTAFNGVSANVGKILAPQVLPVPARDSKFALVIDPLAKLEAASGKVIESFNHNLDMGKVGVDEVRGALLAPTINQSGCETDKNDPWYRFKHWQDFTGSHLEQAAATFDTAIQSENGISKQVSGTTRVMAGAEETTRRPDGSR
jgi:hypothetical protein